MRTLCVALVIAAHLIMGANSSAQTGQAVLQDSYALSQGLGGTERVFYLTELARVGARVDVSREQGAEWSLALFRLASATSEERTRIAGQKNALADLSFFNPSLALQLLPSVDIQKPGQTRWLYEDLRTNACEIIFRNFIANTTLHRISPIIEQARYIGRTGQYPYRAIATVIQNLPQSASDDADTLFADALSFYATETGFYNRDEEFLYLLQSLDRRKNQSVSRDLLARALNLFAERVQKEQIGIPGRYYSEIHLPGNKIVPFTDRNQAFLFEIFPTIRRFNTTLAAQLLKMSPSLDQAVDGMSYVPSGFVLGNPTSEETTRQHMEWIQESLVERIKTCSGEAPEATARLTQQLNSLSARIVGFSATVSATASRNPSQARALFTSQIADLDRVESQLGRLRAFVALAQAARHIDDFRQYRELSFRALDLGVQLFSSDIDSHPQLRVQRHEGFPELKELITFTASQPSDVLSTKVRKLPDSWLKAYLMLYEGEGHAKPEPTTVDAHCLFD